MNDRQLFQQALDALTCNGEDDDPGHRCAHCDDYVDRNGPLRAALRERLAHCDRCGKKLGGEGDIHTCTPDPIGDAQDRLIAEMAAQPEKEPVAWPCEIEEADFEQDTITLKMLTSEYVIRAGKHWISTTPPAATQPAPAQQPVNQERESLRAAQGEAVMPLIGPLLDAWESCSETMRGEQPEVDKYLRKINRAMEDATPPAAAPVQPVAVPSFIRQRLEREIEAATKPKGMSVHDGRTRAFASDIAYLLKVIDTTPPAAAQRPWVELTEQEELDCFSPNPVTHSKNVGAKLKEKNT